MSIRVEQLEKHFGDFHALNHINLEVPTGSLTALLGPSGCGKTTLLRIIAGLESADSGHIYFNDDDVTHIHARDRHIGFMFQHYALFRHMTVFDNIAFGLTVQPRSKRLSKEKIKNKVEELLALVQLDWLAKAYPQNLSGGQRQRIALARALANEPKILLLDEPFGALDAKVRKELRQWLREIYSQLGITSILVTHDQEEALEMADQIVVMNQGKIEQIGNRQSLYQNPENVFVTEFLGEVNVFNQAFIEHGWIHVGGYKELAHPKETKNRNVVVYVRPEELVIHTEKPLTAIQEGKIKTIQAIGPIVRIGVDSIEEKNIHVILSPAEFRQLQLELNQTVWLTPRNMNVFHLQDMVEYVI